MPNESVNYWKFATIGIVLIGASVAATLLVTGRDSKTSSPDVQTTKVARRLREQKRRAFLLHRPGKPAPRLHPSGAPHPCPAQQEHFRRPPLHRHIRRKRPTLPQPAYPPQSVMERVQRYANERVSSKTEEVLKNAALGAAIGAAVGAAGGAIAGGGSGAGKGAAIGGVTGVAGGTLYGLNENKSHDAQYQTAYASCMRSKGY